ncbi:hypothetical protein IGI37_000061 [Enterococcus sp. AZ194]
MLDVFIYIVLSLVCYAMLFTACFVAWKYKNKYGLIFNILLIILYTFYLIVYF